MLCTTTAKHVYTHTGGGGGERRGQGPRNDVLTTCTAVTLRGGQRIIALFPAVNIFRLSEARSEPVEEIKNASKIEKNNIMHLCFSCISYFSFGTEIAGEIKTQPCLIDLNQQQRAPHRFISCIVFAEQ